MMREDGAATGYPSIATVYDPGLERRKPHLDVRPEERLDQAQPPFRSAVFAILAHLRLTPSDYGTALSAGWRNGTDAAAELVASGRICEDDLASAIARTFDLQTGDIAEGDEWIGWHSRLDEADAPRLVRVADPAMNLRIHLAPLLEELDVLARLLEDWPDLRPVLRISTRRGMSEAMAARSLDERSARARASLSLERPELSARSVLTGCQGLFAGVCAGLAIPLAATVGAGFVLDAIHLSAGLFFGGCIALRIAAALDAGHRPTLPIARANADACLPTYSILVALHKESEVAAQLVAALSALDWPRAKLQVLLVCEADDPETIAAVRRAAEREPNFSLVLVPPSEPRTKPKALNVALPLARGDLIVLYDAEDRPDPQQLRAAAATFAASEPTLACVQAPLIVERTGRSWLAGHFALEYAALFRGLLPFLSEHRLPIPLGGTSNHFRRKALVAVGGWDSHNVAEDADLGMRLLRNGYRVATIDVPTFETAPECWHDWRRQRSRWMKGWMQTWLVHMRNPPRLWRELGWLRFGVMQMLFFGMIAASILHPLFMLALVVTATSTLLGDVPVGLDALIAALDAFNVIGGYAAFALLVRQAANERERRWLRRLIWSVPAYWLLIGYAGLRAVLQLILDPHRWEKTPHVASARGASEVPEVSKYVNDAPGSLRRNHRRAQAQATNLNGRPLRR